MGSNYLDYEFSQILSLREVDRALDWSANDIKILRGWVEEDETDTTSLLPISILALQIKVIRDG